MRSQKWGRLVVGKRYVRAMPMYGIKRGKTTPKKKNDKMESFQSPPASRIIAITSLKWGGD